MLHVGFTVRGEVRHLGVAELQILLSDLIQPGTVTTTDIPQQPIIICPFRDSRSRYRLLPWTMACDPKPAVNSRLGGWQRLDIQNLVYRQTQLFSLAKNKIEVTGRNARPQSILHIREP
jgi:hypothetical protein